MKFQLRPGEEIHIESTGKYPQMVKISVMDDGVICNNVVTHKPREMIDNGN